LREELHVSCVCALHASCICALTPVDEAVVDTDRSHEIGPSSFLTILTAFRVVLVVKVPPAEQPALWIAPRLRATASDIPVDLIARKRTLVDHQGWMTVERQYVQQDQWTTIELPLLAPCSKTPDAWCGKFGKSGCRTPQSYHRRLAIDCCTWQPAAIQLP